MPVDCSCAIFSLTATSNYFRVTCAKCVVDSCAYSHPAAICGVRQRQNVAHRFRFEYMVTFKTSSFVSQITLQLFFSTWLRVMVVLRNENIFQVIFLLECGCLRCAAKKNHALYLIIDLDFWVLVQSFKICFRPLENLFRNLTLTNRHTILRP